MSTVEFKYDLGITVKSVVSGLKGVITSRSQHLNGCNRYWVEVKVSAKKDKSCWLDEWELKVINKKPIVTFPTQQTKPPGGFPSRIR